jgi:Periplasmic copper-binding protein (NosD)
MDYSFHISRFFNVARGSLKRALIVISIFNVSVSGEPIMLKTVRLFLLAFLILGSAVTIQSSRGKSTEQTYLQIINPLTGDGSFNFTVQQKSVGDTFVINITVVNVTAMFAWQFALTWNSSLLTFVNASVPPDNIFGSQNVIIYGPDTSEAQAQLVFGAGYAEHTFPEPIGVNGTGTLAQVELRVNERGEQSDLAFEGIGTDTYLLNDDFTDISFTPLNAHCNILVGKTWYVPQDYPSIPDGIDAASNGDTIQVATGTYPGFSIDKAAIQVAGVENGTIINGTITVNADRVSLTDLTVDMPTQLTAILINGNTVEISNNHVYSHDAQGILATLDVCTITNNFLNGTSNVLAGIEMYTDSRAINNTLRGYSKSVLLDGDGNEVSGNELEGSISIRSSFNQILNNNVSNGNIVLISPAVNGTNDNTITQNTVSCNSTGLILHGDHNVITHNSVSSNSTGILILDGNYSKVKSNTIEAGSDGVNMSDSNGHDNEVSDNAIRASNTGIIILQAGNSSIVGNTIRASNTSITASQAVNTSILGNVLESGNIGIYSFGNIGRNSVIIGNNISGCDTGVKLNSGGWLVFYNNFMNNSVQAEDNGNNTWYNYTVTYDGIPIGMRGNYWSGWNSSQPYLIAGTSGSLDIYPISATVSYPIMIPEFPTFLFTLLFVTLTSLVIVFIKSKKKASATKVREQRQF